MIYISAQPDDLYFLWQLEVQLFNLNRLGLPKECIHVVIGYNPERVLREEFKEFIDSNVKACFFTYPDDRLQKKYLSSIRPNILKKHFKANSYLENEVLFYHDCDIIFRELLDANTLSQTDKWYVSDTRNYIAPSYIKKFGENIFNEMCAIVEVDATTILSNEENAGGAQYVLKSITHEFWEKVERDSESLFILLSNFNNALSRTNERTIQAWCADMWALLWNGLKFGHKIEIHPELQFCWPMQPLEKWDNCKILHNAGVKRETHGNLFCKSLYKHIVPYHDNFLFVDDDKCSMKYVDEIKFLAKSLNRYDLNDVTFLIPIQIDSNDRLNNLDIIVRFIMKYFDTNIYIIEVDDIPRINLKKLPENVRYKFVESKNRNFHRTKILNDGIREIETEIISIYDVDVVVNPQHIIEAVEAIKNKQAAISYPYDGSFLFIDRRNIGGFSRDLSFRALEPILADSKSHLKKSYGGCCFVDKELYKLCGLENEYFATWGRDDIERAKRVQILGYKLFRTGGFLIHFNHYRGSNSKPESHETVVKYDREYLKECNMTKQELQDYIKTWSWVRN